MKRIVNGVTYNTDTSTRLARSRLQGSTAAEKLVQTLYQTRGGAFFIVERRTVDQWDEREQESVTRTERTFHPVNSDEASRWMLEGEVHVFRNPFGDPPEAAAEAEPGATIYIRVPATLKRDADAAAHKENLSGNVWAMRCIERCLEDTSTFDVRETMPLIQKLLDGDKILATRFHEARHFWKVFLKSHSQRPVATIAKKLGFAQHTCETIFDGYGLQFSKEMMPLTCLGSLYDEDVGTENRQLAKKMVEAFRKSNVSDEIKNAYLETAIRVYFLN
jgi:predicted HicB family RNase H-like nuclease